MKIVFVSQPLSTGGAERVVAGLANKFSEMGHEIKIVVVDNGDENIYYTRPEISFFHIAKPSNPLIDLLYRAVIMRKFFGKYKPDVIIPFTTQKNVSVLLATLFTKHKVIACERNNPIYDPKNRILRILRKMLFWTSDGFVFQTENAKSYFSRNIQNRACVIANPINEDIIPPWKGNRTDRIVLVNRLNVQKNIDLAIDAFNLISEKYPTYTMEIYGKSDEGLFEYERHLKQKVDSLGLKDKVLFEGFCHDVHERIKDATVYLITSDNEGMSNSLMEALALGLVCISTDDSNGGARTLIRDHYNGILIRVGNLDDCYKAIDEVLSNQSMRGELSKNAIHIRKELSMDAIAAKWIKYINQIVG